MFGFRRWRATELLWSWCAYWLALGLVAVGPGLLAAWRVTRPGSGHGSVSAGFGNGALQMTVTNTSSAAPQVWSAGTSLTTALLWIAVPPLVLWLVWLGSRPRRDLPAPRDRTALAAAPAQPVVRVRTEEREPVDRPEPRS